MIDKLQLQLNTLQAKRVDVEVVAEWTATELRMKKLLELEDLEDD